MAKKKDASPGLTDASVFRRSGRETSSRKPTKSGPLNSRKSEKVDKHTPPSPSPIKNKLEKIGKQIGSSPLRRSDRGKNLVEMPDLPNMKSTKEMTVNDSKQSSEDVNEGKKSKKQDSDIHDRKTKRFTAVRYKAAFKPQRVRIESDDDENPEVEDKSLQANTNKDGDVGKELKNQNSKRVREAPEKQHKTILEGRVIELDQTEQGDCPQTKSLDVKSIGSGDMDKENRGNVSPSNGNIANSDSRMSHTSSHRIEHDLENQQELDTCHKVTETGKAAGITENAENSDISINMQNSKFVEFWVPVQISNVQLEQYCATLLSNASALGSSSKSDTLGALNDILAINQKCCNHPYTVDPQIEQSLMKNRDLSMIVDVGTEASGKLQFVDHILPEIQKRQLRVLILFQHTLGVLRGSRSLGGILDHFVHQRFGQNSYEFVDGVPNISSKKQANLFNKDMNKFIFLLESRACHPGIKLSSVDAIIIFDSDLNPSNDLKSLQKLFVDSQSEQIMIFRLYSSSTLEEKILKLVENNVTVDIRSSKLRSHFDSLLTWGASDLFDKLTEFHSQTVLNISSEESLLKDVVQEFLYILCHKCKSNDTTSKGIITQVQSCGINGKNTLLHSEVKIHLPNGDQPYIFWRKLLEGRCPDWKFVSESTPRQRKRPNYVLDSPSNGKSNVDYGSVKTRRKNVNNNTIEPAQLKTVTEGETGGVNEGVSAGTNESQSSSGDQFWSTAVNNETSLLDLLKPTVSELCNVLNFSEEVKIIVDRFLEFVLENYKVSKDYTTTLEAFMISLCWTGSSLAKNVIDRSESFALAKKHFNFSCTEEETVSVYTKLKEVKQTFLEHTQNLPALKDSVPVPEGAKVGIEKSKYIPNADVSSENVSRKSVEEIEKINGDCIPNAYVSGANVSRKSLEEIEKNKEWWDEKRASLEHDYNVDKWLTHAIFAKNPLIRSEKLKIIEREFAKKLEEHERSWETHLEGLKSTMLAAVGQVVAENEFSSYGSQHETQLVHSGNPDVASILPENTIEAKNHDEPVCEGVNDIESTGSHTSEKEMVDTAVSSEQIGVPAQQHGDDMEVDVLEKVDSSHENATSCLNATYAVEDNHETGANDVSPHVDCGDVIIPAGKVNKENDEDGTVGLDENDHNETGADDMAPHVYSSDVEMPVRNDNENDDGTVGENDHKETRAKGMAPHADSGDKEMPAVNHNKENDEYGTLGHDASHVVEDRHKTVDDMLPEVESAEIGMPAGRCDKEDAEDGEIFPDTPDCLDVGDDHNESSRNDVLSLVESVEMATPADNEENSEDGIIRPDALHANEDRNISCGSSSSNPVCAAVLQDKSPSVQPVSSPVSDHLEPIIPDSGVQDEETNVGNLQLSDVSQLDQIIPDNESDFPSSTNQVCAAISQDKTLSVQPASSPASHRVDPIFPEIQNNHLQLEQLPDSGVQDEINIGNLQPSSTSQLDQIIPDDEPDLLLSTNPNVAENLSDTPPPSGSLPEPISEETTLSMPQSGENSEENAVPALETPHEEDQSDLATPVAPAPPVNALNMFDNLANPMSRQMSSHTDPLQAEVERLYLVKDNVTKLHQEMKQKLNIECEKEIAEVVAQIRLKYEARHLEADAAYDSKKMDLENNINRVIMNRILAEAFRSKCQDLTPSGNPVSVSQAGLMQQLQRLSGSSSMRHYHGASSSSPGQSSGNQHPPLPPPSLPHQSPQPPPSLPQPPPLPLQQPQLQPPLQIVHQPAALFSSMRSRPPSTTPNRPPPNTSFSTTPGGPPSNPSFSATQSRPPPVVNQMTSSTPPSTTSTQLPTRSPPIVNLAAPSTTPTNSRLPPGINMSSLSALHKRPRPSFAQNDMSAANLRITSETRGQPAHIRPLVGSETRGQSPPIQPLIGSETRSQSPPIRIQLRSETRGQSPPIRPPVGSETRGQSPNIRPVVGSETHGQSLNTRSVVGSETHGQSPHIRPPVSSETRGQSPLIRPLVSSELRAPPPHMRSLASREPRAPPPHLRSMAGTEIRARAPHMQPFRSTPSISPDVGTHRRVQPSQHVTGGSSQSPVIPPHSTSLPQRPPSEPYTVPLSSPSAQTPLLPSDNLNGHANSAARWVNVTAPQPAQRSQNDRLDVTDLVQDGTTQSSAHDLVCLSDDD